MKQNIYVTSDSHFGHFNIIKSCHRPFQTVEEMNQIMVDNWNSVVGPHDLVYHLGDIYMKNPQIVGKIVNQLNGKIILIKGNHDKMKDIKKYFPNRFLSVENDFEFSYPFNDKKYHFVLYHYPIWSWNRRFHGVFHLHGHNHFRDPLWNDFDKNGLSMDVGVDGNNFTPIHIEKVIETIESKKAILSAV